METVLAARRAEYSIVEVCLPDAQPEPVGVILHDAVTGEFRLRFRRDWESLAGDEAEVLSLLADDFAARMNELGAEAWLRKCEDAFSNSLRISDRESILVGDFDKAVERLYARHVHAKVLPFVTHLPKYSARVAAGKFLEDNAVEAEDWVEAPNDLRLEPNMFVVEITGHSMEPRIPDGSPCVFRAQVAGTRQEKLLLIERRDISESGGRYTVKRYRSAWSESGGQRHHEMIRLEPLNPDFEAWELEKDSDLFRVIGEFVRVLD